MKDVGNNKANGEKEYRGRIESETFALLFFSLAISKSEGEKVTS